MAVTLKIWKNKGFLNGDFSIIRDISIELPGYNDWKGDSLMFELSDKNIEHLSKFQSIVWSEEAKKLLIEHNNRILKENTKILNDIGDYKFKTKPFDHQLKAFQLSCDEEYYGYFMEMGTGKTKVVIDNGAYLFQKNKIDCILILAPNGVHAQWAEEQIPFHMPNNINYQIGIYKASSKENKNKVSNILSIFDSNILKIITFNIEALSNKSGIEIIHKFLDKYRCLFVIDESVRIKNPSSLRTKNALKLAPLAKYRRIMSGAPMTKGYEDFYSQFKFLHPDILGFNSFYTFRNYFCAMGGFEGRQIIGYKNKNELNKKIEAYTFRITKEECLNLPDKIYIKRSVDLTPEQEEIYEVYKSDFEKQLESGEIDVDNIPAAITKLLRLQQITCGFLPDDENNIIKDIESNRLDLLLECIEEAQGKVIVWSRFIHNIKQISKKLNEEGTNHVLYYGDISTTEREENIKKFKFNPDYKVFLANATAGGTGLNLAEATTMIYFSNDFNADTRWQSEDRAHRIGQKNNLTIIDIVAKGTIDTKILGVLKSKKSMAQAILDDPRLFLS